MDETLKTLGVIAILVSWIAMGLVAYRLGNKDKTLSQNAAAHKKTFLVFAVAQTIFLPLIFIFIAKWFTPELHLPQFFTVIVGFSLAGFLVAAWIPDSTGRKSVIHGVFAYSAALLAIPATTLIAVAPNIGVLTELVAHVTLAYMVLSIGWLIADEKAKQYKLPLQLTYILLFQVLILAAAYQV